MPTRIRQAAGSRRNRIHGSLLSASGLLDLNSLFPNLIAWYSALQSTLWQTHTGTGAVGDGDVVGYISNLATATGAAHDLTQSSTPAKATYRASVATLGGAPAFDFGGDDYYQKAYVATYSQPITYLLVAKKANTSAFYMVDGDDSTNRHIIFQVSGPRWSANAGASVAYGNADTDAHTHIVIFNGVNGKYYIDGVLKGTGSASWTNSVDGVTYGARYDGASPTVAYHSELVVIDAAATADQLNTWLAAMQAQYGISYTEIA